MLELQRWRLLTATVGAVDDLGYCEATVSRICARAGASRRTFYELFQTRDECMVAVLDYTAELVASQLAAAKLKGLGWRERVRLGLWVVLATLEGEPALARVCIVQAARGETQLLERRAELLEGFATVLDEGRPEDGTRAGLLTALNAEGLVGAALTILHARLWRGEREPLSGVYEELLGMILLPYIGAAATRREQARARPAPPQSTRHNAAYDDRPRPLPMRLTFRTMRVLETVAERSGASNRQVGIPAGITDPGQISKLLKRLQGLGLLENRSPSGKGEANAWMLTGDGERVLRSINPQAVGARDGAAA